MFPDNGCSVGVVVADSDCGDIALGPLDGRDLHVKASAQTHTKNEILVAFFKSTGFRVCKKLRQVFGLFFAAALTTSSINANQKAAAFFPTRSVFCVRLQPGEAEGVVALEHFWQGIDLPEGERIL